MIHTSILDRSGKRIGWLATAMIVLLFSGCATVVEQVSLPSAESGPIAQAPEAGTQAAPLDAPPTPPSATARAAVTTDAPEPEPVGMTQVGRYTVTSPQPPRDLANPLAVVATVSFPRAQVQTVGDALSYLLLRTGYRLDQARLSEQARQVLTLPLPESHRRLGPFRVADMVQTLVGDAWSVQVDGLVRAVAFQVVEPPANTRAVTAATAATSAVER